MLATYRGLTSLRSVSLQSSILSSSEGVGTPLESDSKIWCSARIAGFDVYDRPDSLTGRESPNSLSRLWLIETV